MTKNLGRCRRLSEDIIGALGLDLSGLTVLTEAATGYYALTAPIAALAGADAVYALTRASRFGTAHDAEAQTLDAARAFGVAERIELLPSRDDHRISAADIVTNLGFVRPLDPAFLQRLKATAVIPLMWETWEFRPGELDLAECRRLGLCVLGTNEQIPELQIFGYIGQLAVKLLHQLEVEVFRSRLVVLGNDPFGAVVERALVNAGAEVARVASRVSSTLTTAAREAVRRADALVVAEYPSAEPMIGARGFLEVELLHALNPQVAVAHICGSVDQSGLEAQRIRFAPARLAPAGYMSVATDYAGPRPLIDLHAAGLRVGELLARARQSGLSPADAERSVAAAHPVAQLFEGEWAR